MISSIFFSFSGTLVRFEIKMDGFGFDFTKSLCLVGLRPAETTLMLWLCKKVETALLKVLLFMALADKVHKNN